MKTLVKSIQFVIVFALVLISFGAHATAPGSGEPGYPGGSVSTDEPATDAPPKGIPTGETTPLPDLILHEAPEGRGFGISLAGSVLGLVIPTKYGPAVSWNFNRRWSAELAYFTGYYGFSSSYLDIGGFRESLILANARFFPFSGSFNLLFGLSRQQYVASLGNDIASRLSNYAPDLNITVETIGLQLGIGNRWTYNHFVFGADWLVVNVPFAASRTSAPVLDAVTNADDRRRIDDAIKFMRYLPTGALLKLSVGYLF